MSSRFWKVEQPEGWEYIEAQHAEVQQGALLRFYSINDRGAYHTKAMFHPSHWTCFKEIDEDVYAEHAEELR